jgi:hypothetical protein
MLHDETSKNGILDQMELKQAFIGSVPMPADPLDAGTSSLLPATQSAVPAVACPLVQSGLLHPLANAAVPQAQIREAMPHLPLPAGPPPADEGRGPPPQRKRDNWTIEALLEEWRLSGYAEMLVTEGYAFASDLLEASEQDLEALVSRMKPAESRRLSRELKDLRSGD